MIKRRLGENCKNMKKFQIEKDIRTVFQPKTNEQKVLRQAIQGELNALEKPQEGELLVGELLTGKEKSNAIYDVENVLFYNIGTRCFTTLTKNGLAFFKKTDAERGETFYQYRYSLQKDVRLSYQKMLVHIEKFAFEGSCQGKKADYFWRAVKQNSNKISVFEWLTQARDFAVTLTLYKPATKNFNTVTLVKPLLDGLISAMHRGEFTDEEKNFLSKKFGCCLEWIENKEKGALWARKYYLGRSWNPEDERCVAVVLDIQPSQDEKWYLEGALGII